MNRRQFILSGAAAGMAGLRAQEEGRDGLKVRFLGTGAADWQGPDPELGHRRLTSVLIDGRTLVDFTPGDRDMLPDGCRPEAVFYTHSHSDHYNVEAALALGVKRVYCHASWAAGARAAFAAAAAGRAVPEVRGLVFGEKAVEGDVAFTSLPANHCTRRPGEHCSMYLVEKGATRLLYATDTGGIPGEAARLVGIDAHLRPGHPITALIMEATMGVAHPDDWRLFVHSSVATVAQTVRVLLKTKRYRPPDGRRVYLTHMARTLHGTQAEIAAAVPDPLTPAFDGLEVVF